MQSSSVPKVRNFYGKRVRGEVFSLALGDERGFPKKGVKDVYLKRGFGVALDAHWGTKREVSILLLEDIEKVLDRSSFLPGLFCENVVISGIGRADMKIGSILRLGRAKLVIFEVGKSEIADKKDAPLLARIGFFAKVIKSAKVFVKDPVFLFATRF